MLEGNHKEDHRNYVIAVIMAKTGARISEVLDTQLNDFNLTSKEWLIRKGKGSKQRIVYFNDFATEILKHYLQSTRPNFKGAEISPYLFLSNQGCRLNRTAINKAFKKANSAMNLDYEITPHTLRHFFCSHALEAYQ